MGPGQAAQTAKRPPEFSATYAAISRRRGKKISTIAIARKLLTRAYHLLAAEAFPASGPEGVPRPDDLVTVPHREGLDGAEPASGAGAGLTNEARRAGDELRSS